MKKKKRDTMEEEVSTFSTSVDIENEVPDTDSSFNPYLQIQQEIEFIKKQQKEYEIAIRAAKLAKERDGADNSSVNLRRKLNNLAMDYNSKTVSAAVQDTIFSTLQLSDTLHKSIFLLDENADAVSKEHQEELIQLSGKLAEITDETMGLRKEVKTLENNVLQTELETQKISRENINLLKKIDKKEESIKKEQEAQISSVKREQIQREIKKTTREVNIVNQVLQKSVTFSGLTWANDSELKSIVLDCGKPLELQLSELAP